MKLGIGIPILGDVPGEAFASHTHTIADAIRVFGHGEVCLFTSVGIAPHDHARQVIVDQALAAGVEKLLFIDADTLTPPRGIECLLTTMEELKVQAVSGYYIRRGSPYTPVWAYEAQPGKWVNVVADPGSGWHDIHVSGLGCCLLDLQWINKNVPKPWFKMRQTDEWTTITDDVVLFEGMRKAGGKLVGQANVVCPHLGKREFVVPQTTALLQIIHKEIVSIYGEFNPDKQPLKPDGKWEEVQTDSTVTK